MFKSGFKKAELAFLAEERKVGGVFPQNAQFTHGGGGKQHKHNSGQGTRGTINVWTVPRPPMQLRNREKELFVAAYKLISSHIE